MSSSNLNFSEDKLRRFLLPFLFSSRAERMFGRVVPVHLDQCSDDIECKFPCRYENGYNRYLYLDGKLFGSERLKLGSDGKLIVKHEIRTGENFLSFASFDSVYNARSPYVGKMMKKIKEYTIQ